MKEKLEIAEKSVLLLIPYLIVLSLAYYWGYWGTFGIDAISYYGVQDLIKGFTYALPVVLLLGIFFIISNAAMGEIMSFLNKRFNRWLVLIAFIIASGIVFWFLSDRVPDNTTIRWELFWVGLMMLSTLLEALFGAVKRDWQWAASNVKSFFLIKWLTIFCCVSFISSYAYGINEAHNISDNNYFSYMQLAVVPDTAKPKLTFKYLGKAGDSYFFISPNNKEKRIVAASIMPTLVLHYYDRNDSLSIRDYNATLNK
jgi:hypothetical protein